MSASQSNKPALRPFGTAGLPSYVLGNSRSRFVVQYKSADVPYPSPDTLRLLAGQTLLVERPLVRVSTSTEHETLNLRFDLDGKCAELYLPRDGKARPYLLRAGRKSLLEYLTQ